MLLCVEETQKQEARRRATAQEQQQQRQGRRVRETEECVCGVRACWCGGVCIMMERRRAGTCMRAPPCAPPLVTSLTRVATERLPPCAPDSTCAAPPSQDTSSHINNKQLQPLSSPAPPAAHRCRSRTQQQQHNTRSALLLRRALSLFLSAPSRVLHIRLITCTSSVCSCQQHHHTHATTHNTTQCSSSRRQSTGESRVQTEFWMI